MLSFFFICQRTNVVGRLTREQIKINGLSVKMVTVTVFRTMRSSRRTQYVRLNANAYGAQMYH